MIRPLHYLCAVLAFGCAIVSIAYGGGRRFRKLPTRAVLRVLDRWRVGCIAVIAIGVLFPAYALLFAQTRSVHPFVIVAEGGAFLGFGAYWLALTWCVAKVNDELREKRKPRTKALVEKSAVDTVETHDEFEIGPLTQIP